MIRIVQGCPNQIEKDNFRTVVIDKTGNYRIGDGYDEIRDLIKYSAKYDEHKNIYIKIKTQKYDKQSFLSDSSVVVLLDFLRDYGTYILPFNIRGATDHWWEIALSIKYDQTKEQVAENTPHLKDKQIIQLTEINPQDSEITLKIDTQKLKELGWIERMPLYVQILTHKGEIITDSFNDPKPYDNANFIVGAIPINNFLNYNSECVEIK
ncbi:MAG: hypothetical protein ABDH21_02745 [bacterium]